MTTEEFEMIYMEGTLSQAVIGIKAMTSQENIFKQHKHRKLLDIVKKCKNVDDLKYLLRDYNSSKPFLQSLADKVQKCEKLGDCSETKQYYKGCKKKYIDKGITSKDITLYLQWLENEYKPAISKRIKEIS